MSALTWILVAIGYGAFAMVCFFVAGEIVHKLTARGGETMRLTNYQIQLLRDLHTIGYDEHVLARWVGVSIKTLRPILRGLRRVS